MSTNPPVPIRQLLEAMAADCPRCGAWPGEEVHYKDPRWQVIWECWRDGRRDLWNTPGFGELADWKVSLQDGRVIIRRSDHGW